MTVLAGRELTTLDGGSRRALNASMICPGFEGHRRVTADATGGEGRGPHPSSRGSVNCSGAIKSGRTTGVSGRHLKTLQSSPPLIFGMNSAGMSDWAPDQHARAHQDTHAGDGKEAAVPPRQEPGDEANDAAYQGDAARGNDGLARTGLVVRGVGGLEAQAASSSQPMKTTAIQPTAASPTTVAVRRIVPLSDNQSPTLDETRRATPKRIRPVSHPDSRVIRPASTLTSHRFRSAPARRLADHPIPLVEAIPEDRRPHVSNRRLGGTRRKSR